MVGGIEQNHGDDSRERADKRAQSAMSQLFGQVAPGQAQFVKAYSNAKKLFQIGNLPFKRKSEQDPFPLAVSSPPPPARASVFEGHSIRGLVALGFIGAAIVLSSIMKYAGETHKPKAVGTTSDAAAPALASSALSQATPAPPQTEPLLPTPTAAELTARLTNDLESLKSINVPNDAKLIALTPVVFYATANAATVAKERHDLSLTKVVLAFEKQLAHTQWLMFPKLPKAWQPRWARRCGNVT